MRQGKRWGRIGGTEMEKHTGSRSRRGGANKPKADKEESGWVQVVGKKLREVVSSKSSEENEGQKEGLGPRGLGTERSLEDTILNTKS
jgi:hypothetical protein